MPELIDKSDLGELVPYALKYPANPPEADSTDHPPLEATPVWPAGGITLLTCKNLKFTIRRRLKI